MLKQRIITAVIAAAVIVGTIFLLPTTVVAIVFLIVVCAGGWEWAALTDLRTPLSRGLYVLAIAVACYAVWVAAIERGSLLPVFVAVLWWLVVLLILAVYQGTSQRSASRVLGLRISGFVTLVPAWIALVALHLERPALLFYLLVLVWIADIAAYFAGRRFGKTKLAPALSPGKTRAGVVGALAAASAYGALGLWWLELEMGDWVYFIMLCLLIVLLSVMGDLYESLLKREAGAKDSGTLLPGHGGVLDRIDSVTAAAPVFLLGWQWIR